MTEDQPKRRRGRPRKNSVDITKAATPDVVDQINPTQIPDGPTGPVEAVFDTTSVNGPNTDVPGLTKEFIKDIGQPKRARDLVEERGHFVKVEPLFSNFCTPDYEKGPQQRTIGEVIHRYYAVKRMQAAKFDPASRQRIAEPVSAWMPELDYEKLAESVGPNTFKILATSDASRAQTA